MRTVAICGSRRKCGKTTVAEALIRGLVTKGYTVASAKDVHVEGFSMDAEGKDSWRHREAGASTVVVRGPLETTIMRLDRLSLEQISRGLQADFLVAEGFPEAIAPKIVCAHDVGELPELVSDLTIGVSGKVALQVKQYEGLPVIDALNDAAALVELVEQKAFAVLPDCPRWGRSRLSSRQFAAEIVAGSRSVEDIAALGAPPLMTVNGRKVGLNRFVRRIVIDVLEAITQNLRDVGEGDIEVHIPARERRKR